MCHANLIDDALLNGTKVIYLMILTSPLNTAFYPCAMRCRGGIVRLLWFRQSVSVCICRSHSDLVNTIETKLLSAYLSNLADMFAMTRG